MKAFVVSFILMMSVWPLSACANTRDELTTYDQSLRRADSLYRGMQFRNAYDLYLRLLDDKEAQADSEKRLYVLNSLCNASELAGHKTDQTKWIQQLLDLARQTGNDYYHSLALMALGKRVYYEGNQQQGIRYVSQAVDLMARTDRVNTDHLTHSQLIILAALYRDMKDYAGTLRIDERNVRLTREGTRWGQVPQLQLSDQRMALAKMALTLAKMSDMRRADSVYDAWKAVPYEGYHVRDYFIVDYLRVRGRYQEAATIYKDLIGRIRAQGDTLGDMMNFAKWGLAEVCQKMGDYRRAANLYEQVLEINDTLRNRQARSNAQELAAAYHAHEQEETILRQQNALERKQVMLVATAVIALLILGFALYAFRKQQTISLKNQALVKMINASVGTQEQPPFDQPDTSDLFATIDQAIRNEQLYANVNLQRQDICDRFGIGRHALNDLLNEHADGQSFTRYINAIRLAEAVTLLRDRPDMPLAAIAETVGFTPSNLREQFKKKYGMTPQEYRQSM